MYMGVIPLWCDSAKQVYCAPHVYGGDPEHELNKWLPVLCSPCIWG